MKEMALVMVEEEAVVEEGWYRRLEGLCGQNIEGQGRFGALGVFQHLQSTEFRLKNNLNVYPAGESIIYSLF